MNFRPNPLLYGANEDFYSSFKLAITMRDTVKYETLCRAVSSAMKRYPYFSVYPEKCENNIILAYNEKPVPVFNDGRCVILGTEESNGHLLAFGCEGKKIFLHASHYIADGMGIDPLLKTVLYLYVSELYGNDGLNCERINMPDDPVLKEEYEYPFPDTKIDVDDMFPMRKTSDAPYGLDPDKFDCE